ncbi:MAG: hypothetical protein VCE75_13990, partial [Alphaproteobacteria bacterium]
MKLSDSMGGVQLAVLEHTDGIATSLGRASIASSEFMISGLAAGAVAAGCEMASALKLLSSSSKSICAMLSISAYGQICPALQAEAVKFAAKSAVA